MIKLEQNEKLVAVFRKHIFYFGLKVVGLILLAILPLALALIAKSISPEHLGAGGVLPFMFALYFAYLVVLWAAGFVMWTDYYLDMWILTDKRLIDVDQNGLFARDISSLRLDRIQDVKVEVIGVMDTMLHIGTVHVQTAGVEKEFIISHAKDPNRVKELILAEHNREVDTAKAVRIENPQG